MERNIFLFLLFCSCSALNFEGKLEDRLNFFERMKPSAIAHHLDKRAVNLNEEHEKIVNLDVLGQHFRLHLKSLTGLFAPNFQVIAINEQNEEEEIFIDQRDFFTGTVEGEADSRVSAHWQGGNMAAIIHARNDVFVVELSLAVFDVVPTSASLCTRDDIARLISLVSRPSWRHITDSEEFPMIAYRFSDMKRKVQRDMMGGHFCGHVGANGTDYAAFNLLTRNLVKPGADFDIGGSLEHDPLEDVKQRYRRQGKLKTRCTLAIVADYTAFEDFGQSDISTTVKYMVSVVNEADSIFRQSRFGSNFLEYGLAIKRVIVHTAPTGSSEHYNKQTNSWDITALLNAFSSTPWDDVCLAHLFTNRAFSGGVLGLAWVAGQQNSEVGGICQRKSGGKYYNTGWSSSTNSGGSRLTTLEASLVTTHELGHGFGGPHDPATSECAPDSDGKFIMYPYSVDGTESNNNKFSPCSRTTIGQVLQTKSWCFDEPGATSFCGNQVVEPGEECDPGLEGSQPDSDGDSCCTNDCRFKSGSACSDLNHACCSGCQIAPVNTVCSALGSQYGSCRQDAVCNGVDSACDESAAAHKPNGTSCGFQGACSSGECLSFCESNGLRDCRCGGVTENQCRLCCSSNGHCNPVVTGGSSIGLTDGTPCDSGYCDSGSCKTEIRDLTRRLWDIIDDVESFSGFVKFMRNNIVLSVVVLSLIVYLPFVIVILVIDYRRDKEDDDDIDWHKNDTDLVSPHDSRDIRDTYVKPLRSVQPRGSTRSGHENYGYQSLSEGSIASGGRASHLSATGVDIM